MAMDINAERPELSKYAKGRLPKALDMPQRRVMLMGWMRKKERKAGNCQYEAYRFVNKVCRFG